MVATEVEKALAAGREAARRSSGEKPFVILVVGVNGSGKTTPIGKLAANSARRPQASCSRPATRSAPPIDQLKIWGKRTGAAVIASESGRRCREPRIRRVTAAQARRRRRADRRHRGPPAEHPS